MFLGDFWSAQNPKTFELCLFVRPSVCPSAHRLLLFIRWLVLKMGYIGPQNLVPPSVCQANALPLTPQQTANLYMYININDNVEPHNKWFHIKVSLAFLSLFCHNPIKRSISDRCHSKTARPIAERFIPVTADYIVYKLAYYYYYNHFHWKKGILTLVITGSSMRNIQDRYRHVYIFLIRKQNQTDLPNVRPSVRPFTKPLYTKTWCVLSCSKGVYRKSIPP